MLVNFRDLVLGRIYGGGCVIEVVCVYDVMCVFVVFCGRCGLCMFLFEVCFFSFGLISVCLNFFLGLCKLWLCGFVKIFYNLFVWWKDVYVSRSRILYFKIFWVIDFWGYFFMCLIFIFKCNWFVVVWFSVCYFLLDVCEDLVGFNSVF